MSSVGTVEVVEPFPDCQLLTYKDDVDLEKKLAVWERFYNNDRPHGAHKGKTPYEVLREKLN